MSDKAEGGAQQYGCHDKKSSHTEETDHIVNCDTHVQHELAFSVCLCKLFLRLVLGKQEGRNVSETTDKRLN